MQNHEVRIRTSSGVRLINIGDAYISSLCALDRQNGDNVALFIATYLTLLADSPLSTKPYSSFVDFLTMFRKDGVKATIVRFSSLAHTLVSQVVRGDDASIGAWIPGMKQTPVFKEYLRFFQTGDVSILRYLYTFLLFGKKLQYTDPEFDSTALRGWIDTEVRLNGLSPDAKLLSYIKAILATCLPPLIVEDFRPKFGPGAVAERKVKGRIRKVDTLTYDSLIDRYFFQGPLLGRSGREEEVGLTPKVLPDPTAWDPAKGTSSRTARLAFVPKNVKQSRSISMEPSTLMYFQQGLLRTITELLVRSPLGFSIRLEDQTYNQRLAFLGSFSGRIDTLDLSAASDSVHVGLVRACFPESWSFPMLATRSDRVELPKPPEGQKQKYAKIFRPKKFAPMGSALCFPTQCIVFWSICVLSACERTYEQESKSSPPHSMCKSLVREDYDGFLEWLTPYNIMRVVNSFERQPVLTDVPGKYQALGIYGDDICIDARLTARVKTILSELGFIVNHEKSFVGAQAFRESCGSYYMNGYDVKPLYYTVEEVSDFANPKHVASHVALINESWKRNLRSTYRFLRQSILHWRTKGRLRRSLDLKWNPIPFVTDDSKFGILCSTASNTHLLHRKHGDYQRTEICTWQIVDTEKYKIYEKIGLRQIDLDDNPINQDRVRNLHSAVIKYEYEQWWSSRSLNSPTLSRLRGQIEPSGDGWSDFLRRKEERECLGKKAIPKDYDTGQPGLVWRWIPDY